MYQLEVPHEENVAQVGGSGIMWGVSLNVFLVPNKATYIASHGLKITVSKV